MDVSAHYEQVKKYLFTKIDKVMKAPHGAYKYPFVDPGSIYDGNLWDWDSYFVIYAMVHLAKQGELPNSLIPRLIECGKGNVLNFLSFQLDDGYIPMMVCDSDGSVPYLNEKHLSGAILNMHKPFLCKQVKLVSDFAKDYEWISPHYDALKKYLACYEHYYYKEEIGLFVFADDVMIGIDNDPSVFGRPRFSTASIYLNSFLISEFFAMRDISNTFGKTDDAKFYEGKANALKEAVLRECYDGRDKIFYSVDADIRTRPYDWFHKGKGVFWNTLFIKVRSFASFIPMAEGFISKEQASHLRDHIFDEDTYMSPHGVRSLSKDERMYNLEKNDNPSNWLGPIWIIAQYLVFRGLMNYGYIDEAKIICDKTLCLLGKDIEKTGDIHEYYNPETGEPINNPGFVNWNILALNMYNEVYRG